MTVDPAAIAVESFGRACQEALAIERKKFQTETRRTSILSTELEKAYRLAADVAEVHGHPCRQCVERVADYRRETRLTCELAGFLLTWFTDDDLLPYSRERRP